MAASTSPKFSKKQAALLQALCHADKKQRKALLRSADKSLIKFICEITVNVLNDNIPLKPCAKKRLRKHKNVLRKLVSVKKNQKNGWENKKKVILQSGGGAFLPLVITPLINALASTIFSAISKDGKST